MAILLDAQRLTARANLPKAEYSTTVAASPSDVWTFVRDMDNWAPFLTGYQSHATINEQESKWFLKGELGGLTRMVEFKVKVVKWNEPDNVQFALEGVNEPIAGDGEFAVKHVERDRPAIIPAVPGYRDRLYRWIYDLIFGHRAASPTANAQSASSYITTLRFSISLTARGMTGPVFNALLTPMLKPATEDLAVKIAAAIAKH